MMPDDAVPGRWFSGASLLLSLVIAGAAQAIPRCAPHAQMENTLAGEFKEVPVGGGLIVADRFSEFYLSPTGSWTVTVTSDGISCIIAGGVNWQFDLPPAGRDA